ncbi:MAG: undecaprenyl-diphosphate phosphatase [Deltaproteobacteria bacterium]|nr:MAG: undecaprenyl-diphosphate phosphatase [Deltaproteobacteria bacterium]
MLPSPVDPWQALVLGAVQGATEFLPVSSSGHLALAARLFGIDPAAGGHLLSVVVHGGTLAAVLVAYRRDVARLIRGLAGARDGRRELAMLVVGTLPLVLALVPGVRDAVVALEGNVRAVGAALVVTALLLASTRWAPPRNAPVSAVRALAIGVAQLGAIVPGVSRSGSTIATGLWLGLAPDDAARFSFLLSIPAILGAQIVEAAHLAEGPPLPTSTLALAFVASFVVGFACLTWLLAIARRGRLWVFVPYLLVVGTVAIALG